MPGSERKLSLYNPYIQPVTGCDPVQ